MAGLALVISVPMLDLGTAAASPSPPTTAASVTTAPTPYTVKSGDSLAGIANRYGVGFSALLKANSMTIASVIHPGDVLTLPAGAKTAPSAPSASSRTATIGTADATQPASAAAPATTYVVKIGDALAGIAWKNGVKLGALVKANSMTTTSVIHPGQTLNIPPATLPIPATLPGVSTAATTSGIVAPASAAATSASVETVLAFLRTQVGVPYKFFSAGPDAYDCSGLVVAGWKQIGVTLPHQSQALAAKGAAVDWLTAPIQAGDLVFTSTTNDPARITHVGIALSDTTWIQAVGVGRTVSIGALPSDAKIVAVRRLP